MICGSRLVNPELLQMQTYDCEVEKPCMDSNTDYQWYLSFLWHWFIFTKGDFDGTMVVYCWDGDFGHINLLRSSFVSSFSSSCPGTSGCNPNYMCLDMAGTDAVYACVSTSHQLLLFSVQYDGTTERGSLALVVILNLWTVFSYPSLQLRFSTVSSLHSKISVTFYFHVWPFVLFIVSESFIYLLITYFIMKDIFIKTYLF